MLPTSERELLLSEYTSRIHGLEKQWFVHLAKPLPDPDSSIITRILANLRGRLSRLRISAWQSARNTLLVWRFLRDMSRVVGLKFWVIIVIRAVYSLDSAASVYFMNKL